jgi:hypothetical protein
VAHSLRHREKKKMSVAALLNNQLEWPHLQELC